MKGRENSMEEEGGNLLEFWNGLRMQNEGYGQWIIIILYINFMSGTLVHRPKSNSDGITFF